MNLEVLVEGLVKYVWPFVLPDAKTLKVGLEICIQILHINLAGPNTNVIVVDAIRHEDSSA